MEKLIEILNEYERESCSIGRREICGNGLRIKESFKGPEISEMLIISKKFGFIEWLVENDKIELDAGPLYGCQLIMHNRKPYTLCETILMLLAIEDKPIELLISILK